MTKTTKLSAEDHAFFTLVSHASFANPFSEQRTELDIQMAGTDLNGMSGIDRAIDRVRGRIRTLEREHRARLDAYATEEDRRLFGAAALFDLFHDYLESLDRLILDQQASGDTPCPVPFASEAISRMVRRGFSRADAIRYFALFYQLRRAFYFIRQSLTGACPSMRRLRMHLWNNLFTCDTFRYVEHLRERMEDFSTLLLGETGAGKGAAARAIGRSGFIPFQESAGCFTESFNRSFIAINLSEFSSNLIESELFGHRKGAFTGALDAHEGVFARCSPHGAIFLDEIGECTVPLQIKLLQVLQERAFSPVGSHERKRFSGRVIAATNQSIDEKRRTGAFRDDFYYRLCSDVIHIPPLRQRLAEDAGELPRLVSHILLHTLGHESPELADVICAELQRCPGTAYSWPGNVREVEQAVRRILLNGSYAGDFCHSEGDAVAQLQSAISTGSLTAAELLASYCQLLFQHHGTYEEVARRTGFDRRTAKKYITAPSSPANS